MRVNGVASTHTPSTLPPRFRYLLCASGDFVKMYSVATEETLRLMGGHADLVTGIQLNPHNHMQVCWGRRVWLGDAWGAPATWPNLSAATGCLGAGWSLRRGWERLERCSANVYGWKGKPYGCFLQTEK